VAKEVTNDEHEFLSHIKKEHFLASLVTINYSRYILHHELLRILSCYKTLILSSY
jgi:hypothetical protein